MEVVVLVEEAEEAEVVLVLMARQVQVRQAVQIFLFFLPFPLMQECLVEAAAAAAALPQVGKELVDQEELELHQL